MRRIGIILSVLAVAVPVSTAHAEPQSVVTHRSITHVSARTQKKLGQLRIPALKIIAPVYEGVTNAQFNIGVGEWPGSPAPGTVGNIVIGGHRTAAQRPFANIDKLKTGDVILLSRKGVTFRYVVSKTIVVTKTDIWITRPTSTATLTLFSCHPKGQTSHRYVVRASYIP